MGFLTGKRALVVGVATERSIAWGIAQALHREGAELAFSYANDKFKERVVPLAELDVAVEAVARALADEPGAKAGDGACARMSASPSSSSRPSIRCWPTSPIRATRSASSSRRSAGDCAASAKRPRWACSPASVCRWWPARKSSA